MMYAGTVGPTSVECKTLFERNTEPMNNIIFDKLYKVHIKERIFSDVDYHTIRMAVNREYGRDINYMPNSRLWETSRGLWTKRFQSWMYKQEVRVNPKFLSDLGGVIGKMTVSQFFYIDFVKHSNWTPGKFGEKVNSCWFTPTYGAARLGLFEHGGFAMRFFSSARQRSINRGTKGIGRAWVYPYQGNIYLFNSYGYELPIASLVLSQILGVTGKATNFSITDAYINNEKAYIFSDEPVQDEYRVLPKIHSRYVGFCEHCHEGVRSGDESGWHEGEGKMYHIYHDVCAAKVLTRCYECSSQFPTDKVHTHPDRKGEYICDRCMRERYVKCRKCHKVVHARTLKTALYYGRHGWDIKVICNDCHANAPTCLCGKTFASKRAQHLHHTMDNCRRYNDHKKATRRNVSREVARDGIERARAQANPEATPPHITIDSSYSEIRDAILAGGEHVESPSPRQTQDTGWGFTMARLRGDGQAFDWSSFTSPVSVDPGLPEQADAPLRTGVPADQTGGTETPGDTVPTPVNRTDQSGIPGNPVDEDAVSSPLRDAIRRLELEIASHPRSWWITRYAEDTDE
jgi:hypothetical protein